MGPILKAIDGKDYESGQARDVLYASRLFILKSIKTISIVFFTFKTSGSSKDWVYEEMNVELSWTWELRDTGDYSAEMPESVIPIQWEETEAGLKALLKFLDEN